MPALVIVSSLQTATPLPQLRFSKFATYLAKLPPLRLLLLLISAAAPNMLEYDWGNPSAVIVSGDEPTHQPDPNRPLFDHYHDHHSFTADALFNPPPNFSNPTHFHDSDQHHAPTHFPQLYDPRTYSAGAYPTSHHSLLSLDQVPAAGGASAGYFVVPKTEEVSRSSDFMSARIGLNLGGRTYFSSAEDHFVNRLYRRSRPGDPGSMNAPRCQAEGCHADLSHSKHYHRRHKVCEFHSKASTVIANGLTQRFCQQCSRFHLLSEFDNGKRSCRKRLADHNRRRRKSQQLQPAGSTNMPETTKSPKPSGRDSSSDNLLSRSPTDSGAHSSSSVTVAMSPPRMSLDCFRRTTSSYQ